MNCFVDDTVRSLRGFSRGGWARGGRFLANIVGVKGEGGGWMIAGGGLHFWEIFIKELFDGVYTFYTFFGNQ